MTAHRIVFLDAATISVPVHRPAFAHEWVEYPSTRPEEVAQRIADATIVISNKVRIDDAAMDAAPNLRFIAIPATGTNNVDLEACRRRGILVSNVRGYGPHAVAEHVFALILALRRNLIAYADEVRAGRWEGEPNFCFLDYPVADLYGSTLGLVGSGAIGSAVARIAAGFGMTVLRAERRGATTVREGYTAFDDVLAQADVLSLHLPLTEETRHLIDKAALTRMKHSALLINTARGPLVDESALAGALQSGEIAGAGLDVLSTEPPRPGSSPLRTETIAALPNLIITPHVAWASETAQTTLVAQLIRNIEGFVARQPLNLI